LQIYWIKNCFTERFMKVCCCVLWSKSDGNTLKKKFKDNTKGYPFQNDVCKDSYVRSTVPIHNTSYNLNPNLNLGIYVSYFNTTLIRQWSLFGSVFIYKWFMPNFSKIINIIFANLLNKELFHRTVHESLLYYYF
jgi:hypothetical protein